MTMMQWIMILFLSLLQVEEATAVSWRVQELPVPNEKLVNDPDGILNEHHRSNIEERVRAVDKSVKVTMAENSEEVPVQLTVVVIEKMNLDDYGANADEDVAAKEFATVLHNTWGVGYDTSVGGTGVLIFLSVYDRVVYISRGGALDKILSDSRLDSIIQGMRSPLKQAKYGEGLLYAVEAVDDFLGKGEPTWKEFILDLFKLDNLFIILWLGVLVNGIWNSYRQRQEQLVYAQAASQLSELDRAQAQALQGRYEATSCPICLENFISSTEGSDNQPIKLLRCGHVFDETCWSEWVHSGQGNVMLCPICKKDVGPPPPDNSTIVNNNISHNMSRPGGDAIVEQGNDPDPNPNRALQLFQQERNFRLMRLSYRYPRYVTPNQVQRWTSPTYHGSLVRDQAFAQQNPQTARQTQGSGGGDVSHSRPIRFGGGHSSGGRSGRF